MFVWQIVCRGNGCYNTQVTCFNGSISCVVSCNENEGIICPNGWNGNDVTRNNAFIDLTSVNIYNDDIIDKSLFLPSDLESLISNYLRVDYETDSSRCGKNCDSTYSCQNDDNSNNGDICCTGV